ncbi:MAG: PAS domain S-box protein [Desulfovibrionaceae bacterium]
MNKILLRTLPVILVAVLWTVNWTSYRYARRLTQELGASNAQALADEAVLRLDNLLRERLNDLNLLADIWNIAPKGERLQHFIHHAEPIILREPSFHLINYVSPGGYILISTPVGKKPELVGLEIESLPGRRELHARVRQSLQPMMSQVMDLTEGKTGVLLLRPIAPGEDGEPGGMLVGVITLDILVKQALGGLDLRDMRLELLLNGKPFASIPPEQEKGQNDLQVQSVYGMKVLGQYMEARAHPAPGGPLQAVANDNGARLAVNMTISALAALLLAAMLEAGLRLHGSRRKLAVSEYRYRTIFEEAPLGIFRSDMKGRMLTINRHMAAMLGCASPAEALRIHNDLAKTLYADPERRREFINLLQREHKAVNFEFQARSADNRLIWINMNARLLREELGAPSLIDGFTVDVTDQKHAEIELKNNQMKLQAIVDNASEGIFVIQHEQLALTNPALAKITGYSEGELFHKPFLSFVHPDDREIVARHHLRRLSGEPAPLNYDIRLLHKGGAFRWTRLSAVVLEWEGQPAVLALVADITAHKEAEQALKQSEERLALALDAANDVLWDWSVATGDVYYSPRFAPMLGYEPEELPPRIETWRQLTHPDDLKSSIENLEDHMEQGRQLETEFRLRTKDGGYKWFLGRGRVVERDASGRPLRIAGTHMDITERKRLEQEILTAKQNAEAASLAKSEFLANISHEIRTPLNGALGMLQLLRLSRLPKEEAGYVETALTAGRSLLYILNDILSLSQIESGVVELKPVAANLRETLDSVLKAFTPQAATKELELSGEVAASVPEQIMVDEGRLRQILFNLVGNAIKFTQQGSVRVEISALPHVKADGSRLYLCSVQDTGPGIPPDKIDSCLLPFTQLEPTLSKTHEGAGLGLRIVSRLVELMEGAMSIETAPGEGANFMVTFRALPVRKKAPQDEPSQRHSWTARILLAEDDPVNRATTKIMLEKRGHEVVCVEDGRQALDALSGSAFDLVLMDVQMPGMDGVEATRKIRQGWAGQSDIPIIGLTAYALTEEQEDFAKAGMDAVLSKPVDMDHLAQAIARRIGPDAHP